MMITNSETRKVRLGFTLTTLLAAGVASSTLRGQSAQPSSGEAPRQPVVAGEASVLASPPQQWRFPETSRLFTDPFALPAGPAAGATAGVDFRPRRAAWPTGYPGASALPPQTSQHQRSEWSPTHFEFEGIAQWRNLSSSSQVSVGPENPVINLNRDLALGGQAVGPLFRFIWKPDKKLLGATSKVRVEYGQITRSHTQTLSTSIDFEGQTYPINATLKSELKSKSFEIAWSPQWGNDKFRIGPMVAYQHLNVIFTLTNLSPGAQPPITREVPNPNNVVLLGLDFDYAPVKQISLYGFGGAIPCCGGGYHEWDSEFGVKYHLIRELSFTGGLRYAYLKRDFTAGPFTVNAESVGPFSGSIKVPGLGPFVGISYRF